MHENQDNMETPISRLVDSIGYLLKDEKERKLRTKLGNAIKNCIFTDEIVTMLNEGDFSGLVDKQEEVVILFSMLFPVVVTINDTVFRLYRHKMEVDFSNASKDRYVFIFSDGRLTSGLFESYRLYDEQYVAVMMQIINALSLLKNSIKASYADFIRNGTNQMEKIQHYQKKEIIAEKNYDGLIAALPTPSSF